MNEAEYQDLREAGWRRKLTPAEEARLQAWLAQHPDHQKDWEAEAGLNQLLGQLRDAPVASNFTARVLQELDRKSTPESVPESVPLFPRGKFGEWLGRGFRRPAAGLAWAAVLMIAGWVGYHEFSKPSGQAQAQDLAVLFKTVGQEPALFEDFDAIHKLPQADDEELYAVLSVQP
jgi:anti-sigma factor RsiW